MNRQTRCQQALATIQVLLGKSPDDVPMTDRDAEAVFLHLRRCPPCRGALTAEQYSEVVSRVLLENE
jgi:hypothetical protein